MKKPSRLYKSVIRYVPEEGVDSGRKFERIQTQYSHKNNFGLGSFYDIAAKYIGGTNDDCGKAMALAAYGESTPKYQFFLKGNSFNNEGAFEHYDGDIAKGITNANHKKYAISATRRRDKQKRHWAILLRVQWLNRYKKSLCIWWICNECCC